MRHYQKTFRIVQSIFILVSLFLLLLVILPIIQFHGKAESDLKFGLIGDDINTYGAEWITDYNKMGKADHDADILFFRNIKAVTEENADQLLGRTAVFETLFSQESTNKDAQSRLEYLTGASYSGFWGRSFENLSDRKIVPALWIDQYETTKQAKWDFHGTGIIITNGSDVIVLEQGKEYNDRMKFKTADKELPYYGSFEITSGVGPFEGEFSIDLTDKGNAVFEKYGLPQVFPAIYKIQRNLYDGYYFAGDFSQQQLGEPYSYEAMPWLLSHKGIYEKYNNEEVYWKAYYPLIGKMITELEVKKQSGQPLVSEKIAEKSGFQADSSKIYLQDGNKKKQFLIKGVNLGAALPGKAFTEFPQDKNTYYQWLTQMAELNINTVRVYTLLPPVFYQALYEYNQSNPEKPLYLLQEIWPEEKPAGNNYLAAAYNETYHQEIEYDIRAIHGDISIPKRSYRSCGIYAYDVSPYLIGYLVGRELEPEEVLNTDGQNKGYRYQGNYVYSEAEASPTESWLAESCDFALSLEDRTYQNRPLAAIVSWPTLDPIQHNSEWNIAGDKNLQYNDRAVIDISHIGINRENVNGFFGAYHIYPNYPDFMNNDVNYNAYQDDQGRFRYGGYLKDFMAQHKKFPALVAEYGLSTSLATAHYSPDGYNHGGLTEKEQAQGIIRMTNAIVKEGYTGAVIFEWMDEWTKKTWNTENYMIPYDRHLLWHNVLDPEQNYGLLANEADAPEMKTIYVRKTDGNSLKRVAAGQDASYLNIELTFEGENAFTSPVSIALSTYAMQGEKKTLWEFNVVLSPEAKILVNPGYNWTKGHFASVDKPLTAFEEMVQLTNSKNKTKEGVVTPEKKVNLSLLKGLVKIEDQKAWIRIPYELIGFSDPSSQKVLYDPNSFIPQGTDQIGVAPASEIKLKVMNGSREETEMTYKTISWNEPDYVERPKDGFHTLADYFKKLQ